MIGNKLETASVQNNSLMRVFVFTLHSFWLQEMYSQGFFWKKTNTKHRWLQYIVTEMKVTKHQRDTCCHTKFPIMQVWVAYSQGGASSVSTGLCPCACMHVCFLTCLFVLRQEGFFMCVRVFRVNTESGRQTSLEFNESSFLKTMLLNIICITLLLFKLLPDMSCLFWSLR